MSDDNVQAIIAILAAFNDGDVDAEFSLVDPEMTYTIRGRGPFAGTYRGVHAVVEVLRAIRTATDDTMTAEPEVLVSDDDHVMAYLRVHGSRPDGRTYDRHQAYLYRFADGRLVEGQTIPVDQYAFDEFTSDPA